MAEPLDLALALSRLGGDEVLLRELAILFLDDYPRTFAHLRNAVSDRQARDIERHAHSLKGSVSNFAANEVIEAAFCLEDKGRRDALADIEDDLRCLEQTLERLKPALESLIAG